MKRNLTCIICPRGCGITVEQTGTGLKVTGNSCPNGEKYAVAECTHPVRTVTSTVAVSNRPDTMVSVKTENPIPKEHMLDAMTQIRRMKVQAPISMGQVLCPDIFGARLVATKEIL